jgi:hypothetical protein
MKKAMRPNKHFGRVVIKCTRERKFGCVVNRISDLMYATAGRGSTKSSQGPTTGSN